MPGIEGGKAAAAMRAPVVRLLACLSGLALAGCSSVSAREDAASTAATRFEQSLQQSDALLGCASLAPGTREELEGSAGTTCAQALPELRLPPAGEVRRVDVDGGRARVVLDADTLSSPRSRKDGRSVWNRTLQNWQSELLAVASTAILAVCLRRRGSPESKPVGAAHSSTGVEG
ncbi:hypothetical protein NLX86_18500 [Streptomyces sp. A3M-1-3]|nr:hypothetical protein [Streptomyces sp. A3M-1-3]